MLDHPANTHQAERLREGSRTGRRAREPGAPLSLPLINVAALQGHTFAAGAMLSLAHDFA